MKAERESYVGKKYEGTMYHLEMSYSGSKYDFYLVDDGSVYHANGKYFLEEGEATQALYHWLEVFCGTEGERIDKGAANGRPFYVSSVSSRCITDTS